MQNNQKGFVNIVAAALILVVFGAGYFLVTKKSIPENQNEIAFSIATVDKIEGWKTYRNELYGYSLEYPPTWYVYDEGVYEARETPYDPQRIVLISPTKRGKIYSGEYELDGAFNIQFKIGSYSKGKGILESEWYEVRDVNIDGASCEEIVATKELTSEIDVWGPTTTYYCEKSGETFMISFENYDLKGTHNKIFDQILSTFKFIDPIVEVGNSNWKTYTNQEYGFEFKYPGNWEIKSEKGLVAALNVQFGVDIEKSGAIGALHVYKNIQDRRSQFNDYLNGFPSRFIAVNGMDVKEISAPGDGGSSSIDYYFEKNGLYYVLLAGEAPWAPQTKGAKETTRIILSTFKFTK